MKAFLLISHASRTEIAESLKKFKTATTFQSLNMIQTLYY